MGRPPSNGGPSFRFNPTEVAEMEAVLQGHNTQVPAREVLVSLAEKFSASPERRGKFVVQMKQVWNWFQNRRYAIRAKTFKAPTPPSKVTAPVMPQSEPTIVRTVPQVPQPSHPAAVTVKPMTQAHQGPQAIAAPSASAGRNGSDNSQMEFEAKSARDGAWYDVSKFLSHKSMETGDPEVLVRFAGFGSEEDEWVNVRKNVRQRSLPCESSECVAVLPGDLILCFQEGKEQALYFDAHVLDAQRRRHDIRGCRCRFLVRYDHDQSEEIVPLRKICRRPETDYRLEQQNTDSAKQSKTSNDPIQTANTPTAEAAHKPPPSSSIISSGKTTEPMAKKMKTDVHVSVSAQVDVSASTLKNPKAVEQQKTFIYSQTHNTLKVCPPAEPPQRFTHSAEPTLSPLAEPALLPQAGPTLSSLAEPPPTAEPALPPTAEPALPAPAEPAFLPVVEPALRSPAEPTLLPATNPPLIPLSEPTLPLAIVPALTPPAEPALQLPAELALPPPAESALAPPAMPPPAEPALPPPAEPTLPPPAEPTLPPLAEPTLLPPAEPALPPPAEPALPPPVKPALPPPVEPALPPPVEPALPPPVEPALPPPAEPALPPRAEPALPPPAEPALTPPVEPALTLPAEPALTLPAEPALTLPAEPAPTPLVEPALTPPVEPTLTPPSKSALTPLAESMLISLVEPTVTPLAEPTVIPLAEPTVTPLAEPTVTPLAEPTVTPLAEPTVTPLAEPTVTPLAEPNTTALAEPTATPPAEPMPNLTSKDTEEEENANVAPVPPIISAPTPYPIETTDEQLNPEKQETAVTAAGSSTPISNPFDNEGVLLNDIENVCTGSRRVSESPLQDDFMIDGLEGMDYVFDDMLASSTDMLDAIGSSGSLQQ
ncbi:unnamed protein product [Cuscuta europaea]|uniref:Homeobox domain-containing protein n=1 Tax=Cuscuta europaea TaxID=41803 RepID=A0A9P0ZH12_CUSEU|nr:unnamed protein product [Cuscuta europaea]